MIDVLIIALLAIGAGFVVVGTIGVLRFPDLPTRLHAVAKADNLGLGFLLVALILDVVAHPDDGSSPTGVSLKLLLIWLLALLASAANSHLLAGHHRRSPLGRESAIPDASSPDRRCTDGYPDPPRRSNG
ncbi:cation:proton antiporter [Microbacterium sp. HMH0099]|uniref:cation:proton antiporter n=1 Tax=Microbacterium sp. HMH0099 TaxID=3414026 RepID=UPI003BF6F70F